MLGYEDSRTSPALEDGMITDMDIGWLYASASGPQTTFVDLTFEVPNIPVVATTAISAFTTGVYEFVPGSVATYVREYAVFTGPNAIDIVDLPPDPANNVCYVEEHCAFVRFRLTVFQAIAWSQACVYYYPAPVPTKPKPQPAKIDWKRRYKLAEYRITDASTGRKLGSHRVFALRKRSVLAVDELVKRSALEAAHHFRVPRHKLEVAKHRIGRPHEAEVRSVF
jgi:hypothetical protein